jgi:hypothetical protein
MIPYSREVVAVSPHPIKACDDCSPSIDHHFPREFQTPLLLLYPFFIVAVLLAAI